jgi:hypothetical protein
MDPFINAELVEKLASLAGYEFAAERCALLVPQLEWLLAEGAPIRDLPMASVEPLPVYCPAGSLPRSGQVGDRDA